MARIERPPGGLVRWLRWAGRILGAGAFRLFVGIVSAVAGPDPWTAQSAVLAIMMAASAAGVALAWWREDVGGMVLIASGVGHSVFGYLAAKHSGYVPVLIAGLPFLLAGSLIIVTWRLGSAGSD